MDTDRNRYICVNCGHMFDVIGKKLVYDCTHCGGDLVPLEESEYADEEGDAEW